MRRIALAVTTFVALVVSLSLSASPAWAATAGQFCKNSEAGTHAIAGNGREVACLYDASANRYRWTYVTSTPGPTTTTIVATTPTTVFDSGDLQGSRIVSFSAGSPTVAASTGTVRAAGTLPTTGLRETHELVELALVLIGLGTALVIGRRPGVISMSRPTRREQEVPGP